MHGLLLPLHSLIRWAVILLGLLVVARGLTGWSGRRAWSTADDRAGRLFVAILDVQVFLGLVLYFLVSPITTSALWNMGAAMRIAVVRFWAVEHVLAMLLALGLAHLGRVRVRAAGEPSLKHRRAAIFFGFALLLVLAGVPWPFMPVARPLWPW